MSTLNHHASKLVRMWPRPDVYVVSPEEWEEMVKDLLSQPFYANRGILTSDKVDQDNFLLCDVPVVRMERQ